MVSYLNGRGKRKRRRARMPWQARQWQRGAQPWSGTGVVAHGRGGCRGVARRASKEEEEALWTDCRGNEEEDGGHILNQGKFTLLSTQTNNIPIQLASWAADLPINISTSYRPGWTG